MLTIKDLHVELDKSKKIIDGLSLEVKPGEVHAIMGPNGSGKSTLSKVIAGHSDYTVTSGQITVDNQDLLEMSPEERAVAGVFLAFQYPVALPGVNNAYFLKAAINAARKHNSLDPIDAFDFMNVLKEKMKIVDMDESFMQRSVNDGFSGGEKKRNEVLQMLMLEPKLAILDETDSGLDIDALQTVAKGVNTLRNPNRAIVVITHYQRLLDYIVPDYVHVLANGKIVKSGDKELAKELEEKGYSWISEVRV